MLINRYDGTRRHMPIPFLIIFLEKMRLLKSREFVPIRPTGAQISYSQWSLLNPVASILMGSATPKLMPLYERMGFQGSGVFFNHAELANEKHELILANILDLAEGRGINARIWYEMYSRVLDFLIENRQIELTPSQNMRLQFLRVIGNTASTLAGSKSLKKR